MKINMPQLNSNMEEGVIVEIPVSKGDSVNEGDILFEVETDKVVSAIEAPRAGVIDDILVEEGDSLKVGETVIELSE